MMPIRSSLMGVVAALACALSLTSMAGTLSARLPDADAQQLREAHADADHRAAHPVPLALPVSDAAPYFARPRTVHELPGKSAHRETAPVRASSVSIGRKSAPQVVLDCGADMESTLSQSGSQLLARIDGFSADCMDSESAFFSVSPRTVQYYSDANMRTVATAVRDRSLRYTVIDHLNIRHLLAYLRAGQYVAFYSNRALVHDSATLDAVESALLAFAANPAFFDPSPQHGALMWDYFVAASGAQRYASLLPAGFRYLDAAISNPAFRNKEQYDAIAEFYNLLIRAANNSEQSVATIYDGDPYRHVELLRRGALHFRSPIPGAENASERASYGALTAYAYMLKYPNARPIAMQGLGQTMALYERLSGPWMAAAGLVDFLDADCASLQVCRSALEPELRQLAFPNKFVFDDGKLVIETALDAMKVQQLYHAIKQVNAQFLRKTAAATPLDSDINSVLTIRIYGSRAAYERFQFYLFKLDTNNGGMYIETGATFYTYERTAAESTFSLEELLRHEYTHYLSGRYIEHGTFGDPIYDGNRLTWFDEGVAEFFAGASQFEGVKLRRVMLDRIRSDGAQRMALSEFLGAGYDTGFRFYHYSALFFNYLDKHRPAQFRELFSHLRANRIDAYDGLVARFKADAQMQLEFTAFLDAAVAGIDLVPPFEDGEQFFPPGFALDNPGQIQAGLRHFLPDAQCTLGFKSLNARAVCRGAIPSEAPDYLLDTAIGALQATAVNNWRTLVCSYDGVLDAGYGARLPYACEVGVRKAGTALDDVPMAPTMVVATPGNGAATVTFKPMPDAYGNFADTYTVTSSPDGVTGSGAAAPISVSGLVNENPYTFTVTATRNGVTSAPSSPSNTITPFGPPPVLGSSPSAASGIGAYIEQGQATITIRWKNPGAGSYALKLDNGTQSLYYGGHHADYAIVAYDRFGLRGDETLIGHFLEYDAQRNFVRTLPSFAIELAQLPLLGGALAAPIIGTAIAGDGSVSVDFTPVADVDGGLPDVYTVTSDPPGPVVTTNGRPISVAGLLNGTTYVFTVAAHRGGRTSPASAPSNRVTPTAMATPEPPSKPADIAIGGSGMGAYLEKTDRGIIIRWRNPPDGGSYSLKLNNGAQSLYYGGHYLEYATVDLAQFGLTGKEKLSGNFLRYAPNNTWMSDYPSFTIDLSTLKFGP